MKNRILYLSLALMLGFICMAGLVANAQTEAKPDDSKKTDEPAARGRHTRTIIYPILVQAPIFGSSLNLPEVPGGGGGAGDAVSGSTDSNLDGAYMAGFTVDREKWFVDMTGIWAGLSADRQKSPFVKVSADVIYFQADAGWRFYNDFAVTGGFRRLAVDLSAELGDLKVSAKPGVWDPLIGLDWRRWVGDKWFLDANFQGGGFGVGADVDLSADVRADWQFSKHFAAQLGYSYLYYKITILDANVGSIHRELALKQSLNGPRFGLGITF